MEIHLQDKLDNQETKQMEKALLLLEGQSKLQRLKVARQEEGIKREQLNRQSLRNQAVRLSGEFSELLKAGSSLHGYREQPLGIETISNIETSLAQQLSEVDACDDRLSVEKNKLKQEMCEATRLELTNQELEKILRRATVHIAVSGEQREIEELHEKPNSVLGCKNPDEPINGKRDLREALSEVSSHAEFGVRSRRNGVMESLGRLGPNSIAEDSNSSRAQEVSQIQEMGSLQLNHELHLQLGVERFESSCMDGGGDSKRVLDDDSKEDYLKQARVSAAFIPSNVFHGMELNTTSTPGPEIREEHKALDRIAEDSLNMAEPISLSVTLPVEIRGISPAIQGVDTNSTPGRIDWEQSLLTVSIREHDGKASVDLVTDTLLIETLTSARKYFESELQQLFNHNLEINEVYQI